MDFMYRNLAVASDDATSQLETSTMLNTLYINLFIFLVLMLLFECNRHLKSVYLKRDCKRFQKAKRVPKVPPSYFFGWIVAVMNVTDEDFLRMVGLDAYVFVRFISLCLK